MSDPHKIIELEVANRHLQLKCHADEVTLLRKTAEQLDTKINEVKSSSQLIGQDRIILMAALSLNHELNLQQQHSDQIIAELEQRINALEHKISAVLPIPQ
jgi:cell division protein ZapA